MESDQFSFKQKEKEAEFNILQLICFSGKVRSEGTTEKTKTHKNNVEMLSVADCILQFFGMKGKKHWY